jgi:hypothetical protein
VTNTLSIRRKTVSAVKLGDRHGVGDGHSVALTAIERSTHYVRIA